MVRALNLDSGMPERFPYTEVAPVLQEAAERISRQTMEKYNKAAESYNQRIENIGPATANLSVLPLQLASLEDAVRQRINDLNGMEQGLASKLQPGIAGEEEEATTAKSDKSVKTAQRALPANTPQSIQDWEKHIDEQVAGQGLEEVDFKDAVLHRYANRYDHLVWDLLNGVIRLPHSASPNLLDVLTQTALAAYEEHLEDQLESRYLRLAGPGINPYDRLATEMRSGVARVSNLLTDDQVTEIRRNIAANATAKATTWRQRPGFDVERQDILGNIPLATEKDFPSQPGVSGHSNWGSTAKSDYAALVNVRRDRDELTVIADGMARIRAAIANLPAGQRGNFLSSPEGQPVLDMIAELANTHLRRFTERYSPDIVDATTGQLDKRKLFSRTGGEGNAYVAIVLSRAFKILATTLNKFRPGAPGGGGMAADAPTDAPAPTTPPVSVNAAAKALFTKSAQAQSSENEVVVDEEDGTPYLRGSMTPEYKAVLRDVMKDWKPSGQHLGMGSRAWSREDLQAAIQITNQQMAEKVGSPKTASSNTYKLTYAKWEKIGKLAGWDQGEEHWESEKLQRDKIYPVSDRIPYEQQKALGFVDPVKGPMQSIGSPAQNVGAKWTGEKRAPRKDEWFLSGAKIGAYCAKADMDTPYHIAKLVRTQVVPSRVVEVK